MTVSSNQHTRLEHWKEHLCEPGGCVADDFPARAAGMARRGRFRWQVKLLPAP